MEKIKSGYVALIGRPNVGKSTLMNQIIGQKIAITSSKPQTTRNKIQTVYTEERGQIVFLDTPGIHKSKNALGTYMVSEAQKTISDADVIVWLVEPSTFSGAGEQHITELLMQTSTPIVLVINKCDTVKRNDLLPVIEAYQGKLNFTDIVPVSALNGENVPELLNVLFDHLPEGPMYYDEDTVTEEPMKKIAEEIIREKALRHLSDEIPHGIAVIVTAYDERKDGLTDISADIICERDSHKGIIIGKGGSMLKKIGTDARIELESLTEGRVNLRLFVKVRKDWRNNEGILRSLGYGDKN